MIKNWAEHKIKDDQIQIFTRIKYYMILKRKWFIKKIMSYSILNLTYNLNWVQIENIKT